MKTTFRKLALVALLSSISLSNSEAAQSIVPQQSHISHAATSCGTAEATVHLP